MEYNINMKIIEFIKNNEDWKEKLESAPYHLTIREDENLVLFKYSQIDSDFHNPIVRESRGIILERGSWRVVCHPFHKFFNYGEVYADKIDWSSAKIQSKEDGSLIKVFHYNDEWRVATNGTINAYECDLEMPFTLGERKIDTFGKLFDIALNYSFEGQEFFEMLDKNETHIFELCSPYNRIVVPYKEAQLFYLASKNNETGEETIHDLLIQRPKEYGMQSIDEIVEVASTLGYDEEGYVVVDKDLRRIKIKSPAYLAAHRLKGNGVVTIKRVLEMILTGEHGEFLAYFPEYKDIFDEVEGKMNAYINKMASELSEAESHKDNSRKDFAMWAKNQTNPGMLFNWLDGKVESAEQFVKEMRVENLAKILE